MHTLDCGHPATPNAEPGTGYATDNNERTYCYECAAELDRERARQGLPIGAYLTAVESKAPGRYYVTTWAGVRIGMAYTSSTYPVRNGRWGTHMECVRAVIEGRKYYGRGFGDGMCISLRVSKCQS